MKCVQRECVSLVGKCAHTNKALCWQRQLIKAGNFDRVIISMQCHMNPGHRAFLLVTEEVLMALV